MFPTVARSLPTRLLPCWHRGCTSQAQVKTFSSPFSLLVRGRSVHSLSRRQLPGLPVPLPFTSSPVRSLHQPPTKKKARTLLFASGAGISLFLGLHVHCQSTANLTHPEKDFTETSPLSSLPAITLYQYQTCPYCSKTRAFMDYYGIPYSIVEVNPVFRREVKGFEYRKLPFIVADGVQVGDSSLIISILRTCMVAATKATIPDALDLYPEVSCTNAKGKTQTERANKYFVMFGYEGESIGTTVAQRREEREWREWVDTKLLRSVPPNIYRTFPEALQTFENITRVGNFGTFQRVAGKYIGAVGMYFLAKSLKKKYHLDPDVRRSLYSFCEEWVKAVGKDRQYMGGSQPNLADLAVYGALNAIEGLQTFTDVMENTRVGPWYWAMKGEVTQSQGRLR